MDTENSKHLLQQLRKGDHFSYQTVLNWYGGDVLRLSYLLLWDEDEAQDILQETMLKFVQMIKERKVQNANGSIKGLLLTIARNLSINRLKQRQRFRPIDDEVMMDSTLHDHQTPARVAQDRSFMQLFDHALGHLTEIQRAVIVLHELNDESAKDIAQTLNLTVENVRMHLSRARKKLRILLEPYVKEYGLLTALLRKGEKPYKNEGK